MKARPKHIIPFLIALFIGLFSVAQTKTSFGLRGNVQITKLSNADLDSKTSGYFGAFVDFRFSDFYALRPELGYSNQGGEAKNNLENDLDIHYISLSISNVLYAKNSGVHFIIAPVFDFDTDDTLIGLSNRKEGNDITFIDVCISAGIGYEFPFGLALEARYKQGLVDVYSGGWHDFSNPKYENETQFNSAIQLGLSFKFN
ncbi:MAG: PorT family protein [Algicola sp.]|nr:PorT family protein [Algicola sp.]